MSSASQAFFKTVAAALLRGLMRIHQWLVVIPVLGVSTLVQLGLAAIVSMLGYPEWASRTFVASWARLNLFVSFVGVDVEGREKVVPNQSYVIVANHQSLYDIYVLYGYTGLDSKWVMKQELRSVPVLGFASEKLGHIIIDRSSPKQAAQSINAAKERIRDGICVVFFAEGTRSRDGNLLPFKPGAFRMAVDLQLPILPISIHGSRAVLPSDTLQLTPGRVRMVIHDPIPTENRGSDAITDLLNETRRVLAAALQQ